MAVAFEEPFKELVRIIAASHEHQGIGRPEGAGQKRPLPLRQAIDV